MLEFSRDPLNVKLIKFEAIVTDDNEEVSRLSDFRKQICLEEEE